MAMIDTVSRSDRLGWVSTVVRMVLGATMLYAGILKLLEPSQALRAVQAYRILPPAIDDIVAYGLPLLEMAVGALLLLGLGTRPAAWITSGLMVVFIAGVASAWLRGLSIDCGCFGGGGDVAAAGKVGRYTAEILRDVGLLTLAVWLVWFPVSRLALDQVVDPGDPSDETDGYGDDRNETYEESSR
jgi:uncharacterized membrane protein YphA (DoxX/SURF4 family)